MITPMEIQNHKFSSKWKGYAVEEVKHFLYAVAEEFEALSEQNHNMASELGILRERVKDMEARDKVLKDTLVTAQQIKKDINENAEREADLIIKEAQLKADTIYEEARRDVDKTRRQVSEVRRVRNDMLAEAEMMVSRFNHFVEAERSQAEESDKLQRFPTKPKAVPKKTPAAAPEPVRKKAAKPIRALDRLSNLTGK